MPSAGIERAFPEIKRLRTYTLDRKATRIGCHMHKWLLFSPTLSEHREFRRGRDSSVGIATRYGLDGPGIESRWG